MLFHDVSESIIRDRNSGRDVSAQSVAFTARTTGAAAQKSSEQTNFQNICSHCTMHPSFTDEAPWCLFSIALTADAHRYMMLSKSAANVRRYRFPGPYDGHCLA